MKRITTMLFLLAISATLATGCMGWDTSWAYTEYNHVPDESHVSPSFIPVFRSTVPQEFEEIATVAIAYNDDMLGMKFSEQDLSSGWDEELRELCRFLNGDAVIDVKLSRLAVTATIIKVQKW